ncbi:hypothetical protein J1N35_017259, partial [Gossypium stocksii]
TQNQDPLLSCRKSSTVPVAATAVEQCRRFFRRYYSYLSTGLPSKLSCCGCVQNLLYSRNNRRLLPQMLCMALGFKVLKRLKDD